MSITFDIKEISKILPHRYPFLLIDRIVEFEEGKRAVGIKNVTMNEAFFQGHFPGFPVMPGVLIVEAMAQVGGIVLLHLPETEGKIAFFAGIDQIRFRRPVLPGDQLRMSAEVLKIKGPMGKMKVVCTANNEPVTEGELMFSLVEREEGGGVRVHPTAIVHPSAKLGQGVQVGPYSVIGPEVFIGDKTVIESHVAIRKRTKIGSACHIFYHSVLGNKPQDHRYKDEPNWIEIGDRNVLREYLTVHLPVGEGEVTRIGSDNFLMNNTHVPHNCVIGNHVTLSSYTGLCGHSVVEDYVVTGGMAGVHQFVRLGKMAMIGGMAKIVQDVPPFMLVDGNPSQIRGINLIGMSRRGVSKEAQAEIKNAYKILFRGGKSFQDAVDEMDRSLNKNIPEVKYLVDFVKQDSKRGLMRKWEDLSDLEAEELILPEIPELGI